VLWRGCLGVSADSGLSSHLISSLSVAALKLLKKDTNTSVHSFASQTIHIL